jgi:tetratricopeptide (TPR) repeat protein
MRMRAWILALPLVLGAAPQDELKTVLERLREAPRELRAEWRFLQDGGPAPRLKSSGRLSLRAPGDVAWTASADRGVLGRAASATGIRGRLRGDALVVHAPWSLEPVGGRAERHPHHGAEWFVGDLSMLPVLALWPEDFPAFALFDLAPRRFLGALPGLFVLGRLKEGAKEFLVLKAQPPARGAGGMRDEDLRGWGRSWTEIKVWIDPADFRLARVAVRSDCDAAGPTEDEWICEYSKRDAEGVPVEMSIRHVVPSRPHLGSAWRCELRAVAGAEEPELRVPEGRIARDWFLRPESIYDARLKADPKDASAWMGLGSLRLQRHEGDAAAAFRRVIALRPDAVEGYVGLLFALERQEAKQLPLLEEAVRSGVKSAQVHAELARRHAALGNADVAGRHFAEALKLAGDVAPLLVEASRLGDAERLLLRALRSEERAETFAYGAWLALRPSAEARLELYRHYEKVGAESARLRARMLDLASGLDQPDEAARHAGEVVGLLKKDLRPDDDYAVDRTLRFFVEKQDFDSAWRLQEAVAAWPDDKWKGKAGSIECRLHVRQDSTADLLRYFDGRFPSKLGNSFSFSPVRISSLTHAIKEEKKVEAVMDALLATPGDHPQRVWRADLLELLVNENTSGSRQREMAIKARELKRGDAGRPEELIQLARTLTHEKKWKEAREKAGLAVARAATPQQRLDAERVIAEAFLGEGDPAKAVEACDRALREDAKAYREYVHLLKAKAVPDAAAAARAYVAAFDDPATRAWTLFIEVRRQGSRWPEIREAVEKGAATAGALSVLALAREATGDADGAADAIEKAAELRKGDLAFVRQRLRLRAAALRIREALADRALLDETDFKAVNQELLAACERRNDAPVLKDFARTLAAEYWSPKRCDSETLSQALQAIREEAFFDEIGPFLLSKSDKDYAPILVTQLFVWAWSPMGWHDKALARCRAVLADPGAAKNHEMMRSWIGSLEGLKREYVDPVEDVARRAKESGERDPIRALETVLAADRRSDRLRLLDRIWRAAVREGKPQAIHFQLGALRSANPAEQAKLLEEVVERFPDAAEWRIRLALLQFAAGKAELGMKTLQGALGTLPADHPAWGSLEGRLQGLPAARLAAVFEEKGVYRLAFELARSSEERLRLAEKWLGAAREPEDRVRAALAAAAVLAGLDRISDALDALAEAKEDPKVAPDLLTELRRRKSGLDERERKRIEELAQGDPRTLARACHRMMRRKGAGPHEADLCLYAAARSGPRLDLIAAWEAVTELEPPTAGGAIFIARLHEQAGQLLDARRELEAGLRRFPEAVGLTLTLARIRMKLEDFRGAAELYEASIARDPQVGKSFDVQYSLVLCLAYAGRKADAAGRLRSMEGKGAYGPLGALASRARLPDEAARLYRRALEEEGETWRFPLARALRDAGRDLEAEKEFQAVLASPSGRAQAAAGELLGLYSKRKAFDESARLLAECLKEDKEASRRQRLASLAVEVPEADRAKVLEAWDRAAGDDVPRGVAGVTLARTWGGTAEQALARLKNLERRAPDSLWVWLEYDRLLASVPDPALRGRVCERLADLDPKGEAGGVAAAGRRAAAIRHYAEARLLDDLLRVGLSLLADPARSEAQAKAAREAMGLVVASLDEEGWQRLKKLPFPAAPAAAKALVEQLSDDEFEKRRQARRALHALGVPALAALVPLVDTADPDLRTHARGAIEDILTQ